ncbi:MAG: hypothetical protein ACI89D_000864 [Bermanella sp.]|jgi:hypothetical protein
MKIESLDPSPEKLETLLEIDHQGPFHFVNLLAFKKDA